MHVLITGASSGIGEAIAREYATVGATLTIVARRREKLEALAADTGAHVVVQDLGVPADAPACVVAAQEANGPVDVLINNAGIQIVGPTASVDCDAGEKLLRLNVHTPLRLIRAVLPGMLERESGTIVNIASMAALAAIPGMTYYNASKGALANASEALHGELLNSPVNVVTVYPGVLPTTEMGEYGWKSMEDSWMKVLQPQGTPEGLAALIRRGVDKKKARVIYPRINALARSFPGATRWLMDRLAPALVDEES